MCLAVMIDKEMNDTLSEHGAATVVQVLCIHYICTFFFFFYVSRHRVCILICLLG